MTGEGDAVVGATPEDDGASALAKKTDRTAQGTPLVEAAMAMWQQGGGGINPDLVKNIRPEHIDKALDHADGAHKRLGEDRKDSRRIKLYALVAVCVVVLILVGMLLFSGNAAILDENLDVVLGFAAGALGGYGIGSRQS